MKSDALGELRLGLLFQAAGLVPDDVVVIRHTLTSEGLTSQSDATGPTLLAYTREQGQRNNKLGKTPPRIWLNFLATAGRRARLGAQLGALYEDNADDLTGEMLDAIDDADVTEAQSDALSCRGHNLRRALRNLT